MSFLTRRAFVRSSLLAMAACGTSVACNRLAANPSNSPGQPLRLGFNLWAGYLPFQTADTKGIFKANGLNAEITWFPALADQITAFNAGKVDVAGLTISDFLTGVSNGVKAKAVLQMDTSLGGDAIVAAPSINSIKDLPGKNASVEVGTVEHLLFLQALKQNDIDAKSVPVINQASDAAITALIAGKTAVAASYEPFITQAIKSGKGKVLFSSKDVPGLIADILVVRQEVLERQPEAIQKLVTVWYQALDYRKTVLKDALEIEAKRAGTSVDEYQQLLKGLKWQTAQESVTSFQPGQDTQSVIKAGEIISEFLISQKIVSATPPSMAELIDDRFLKTYASKLT